MFNFFKSKKTQHQLISDNPKFIIEVEPSGDIGVAAHWKIPYNDQELTYIVRSFVALLILMRDTDAFGVFQSSISEHAQQINDIETAKHIMITYDRLLKQHSEHSDEPMVGPTEAFRYS